ncbi:hypothetical protein ACFYU8_08825 [Brevibacillus sp. NPDC003359]|uniref:hypothetical protein n=1 Tax=unclassified Brevibacillus TaxID=2684853 RepID=UPI0036B211DA
MTVYKIKGQSGTVEQVITLPAETPEQALEDAKKYFPERMHVNCLSARMIQSIGNCFVKTAIQNECWTSSATMSAKANARRWGLYDRAADRSNFGNEGDGVETVRENRILAW